MKGMRRNIHRARRSCCGRARTSTKEYLRLVIAELWSSITATEAEASLMCYLGTRVGSTRWWPPKFLPSILFMMMSQASMQMEILSPSPLPWALRFGSILPSPTTMSMLTLLSMIKVKCIQWILISMPSIMGSMLITIWGRSRLFSIPSRRFSPLWALMGTRGM